MTSGFSPGSLVRARGRDWIVLPDREPSVIRLRPLTTSLADEIGLFLALEGPQISSAEFSPPGPEHPGDATGVMTLFNAARLNLRSGAAPFRSLGRISVTPRPYQFAPLIMALRLDPVRLLIADDVGVGKRQVALQFRDQGTRARAAHRASRITTVRATAAACSDCAGSGGPAKIPTQGAHIRGLPRGDSWLGHCVDTGGLSGWFFWLSKSFHKPSKGDGRGVWAVHPSRLALLAPQDDGSPSALTN
jgi:hypothetical protein